MKIRFGYVAISKNLQNITSSSHITFKYYSNLKTEEDRKKKLYDVTASNLDALYKILEYNQQNNIHFFRISSKLIPLATHPEVLWDFKTPFESDLIKIGNYIKKNKMRVDMHPDQFNVLNSVHEHVIDNTIISLKYHHELLEAMGLLKEELILHIGSKTLGKDKALKRFEENFNKLSSNIKKRIIIENDDKVYNIDDCIYLSKNIITPIVFDYHHHRCNSVKKIDIETIISSWNNSYFIPKVHISSPKEHTLDRRHSDYIDVNDFFGLVDIFGEFDVDFDVMIEAKMKDLAMMKLIEDIKQKKPRLRWIDKTTLEL